MKKTKTIEYSICDFEHSVETEAFFIVQPTEKDACKTHYESFIEEIKLPEELGGDMSGQKIAVDPEYDAQMLIEYKKEK